MKTMKTKKLLPLMAMKRIAILLLLVGMLLPLRAQEYPFQDTRLPIEKRVEDLLSRLTLDEKLSMMEHQNLAIPRLGLQAYSWWNEALHGVGRNGYANVYPMPIALAATWDTNLVELIFRNVAYEAVSKFNARQIAMNDSLYITPDDYTGLTFFTPNINIFRDPRWGRGMETYGEDPFLTAQMGLACIKGLQTHYDNSPQLLTAACLKHLAVHSGPEGMRHEFDSRVSMRDLWTTYLPAFEYIILHSDVQQVMCGYNRLNGEPCCTNRELLVDILRNKWHYDGLLVTDCWALNDCWERDTIIPRHKTHATAALAAADAFGSEVDLECGSGLNALHTAIDSGYISESKIDEHVRRILRTRMLIGIDDSTFHSTTEPISSDALDSYSAMESLVLLKNDSLLPLKPEKRIALFGPNADDALMPLGNYNGIPWHCVTIREGLASYLTTPEKADVIVYAGGLSPQLEGEELPIDIPGFHKGDRTRIELPAEQIAELRQLKQTGKPIVLLLCTGSALALEEIVDSVDAIMVAWYGGQDMGTAVSAALYNNDFFSGFGRLPVTFYRSTSQLPDFEDYNMRGRTYRYMEHEPLYPFGYGLTYSHFDYFNIHYDVKNRSVKCMVANSSPYDGYEVVQVYASFLDDTLAPKKTLVGFSREFIAAGKMAQVEIPIDSFWLRQFDEQQQEPRDYQVSDKVILLVGPNSRDAQTFNLRRVKN